VNNHPTGAFQVISNPEVSRGNRLPGTLLLFQHHQAGDHLFSGPKNSLKIRQKFRWGSWGCAWKGKGIQGWKEQRSLHGHGLPWEDGGFLLPGAESRADRRNGCGTILQDIQCRSFTFSYLSKAWEVACDSSKPQSLSG